MALLEHIVWNCNLALYSIQENRDSFGSSKTSGKTRNQKTGNVMTKKEEKKQELLHNRNIKLTVAGRTKQNAGHSCRKQLGYSAVPPHLDSWQKKARFKCKDQLQTITWKVLDVYDSCLHNS